MPPVRVRDVPPMRLVVAATLPTVRGLVGQIKAKPRAAEAPGPTLDAILARPEGWARGPARA